MINIGTQTGKRADMTRMMNPYPLTYSESGVKWMLGGGDPSEFFEGEPGELLDNDLSDTLDDVIDGIAQARGITPKEIWLGSSTTAVSKFIFEYLRRKWQLDAGEAKEQFGQSPKALIPSPTYEGIITQLKQIGWDVIREEYPIPELYTSTYFESFLHRIRNEKPYLVVIANPNNPTGAFFNPENVASICAEVESYGGYVVVDEAYLRVVDPKGQLSAVQLLKSSSGQEGYAEQESEPASNLVVIESVQKNWPVHIIKGAKKTPHSSDEAKLAVVYASEEIIEGLKNDIDKVQQAITEDDPTATETLNDLIPSKIGILLFMLAFMKPEYWEHISYVLLTQINIVLHTLHEINELAQKQAPVNTGAGEQHPPLLLPEPQKSVTGVMVIGVLKSAVNTARVRNGVTPNLEAPNHMITNQKTPNLEALNQAPDHVDKGEVVSNEVVSNEDALTVSQLLAESGVEVTPALQGHPLSKLYDIFRIVVQDAEQNGVFLLALAKLMLELEAIN
jgi:ribosomal protein L7/L12